MKKTNNKTELKECVHGVRYLQSEHNQHIYWIDCKECLHISKLPSVRILEIMCDLIDKDFPPDEARINAIIRYLDEEKVAIK